MSTETQTANSTRIAPFVCFKKLFLRLLAKWCNFKWREREFCWYLRRLPPPISYICQIFNVIWHYQLLPVLHQQYHSFADYAKVCYFLMTLHEKNLRVSDIISFLREISPKTFGMDINPMTMSATRKAVLMCRNGPTITKNRNNHLYRHMAFEENTYWVHFSP